MKRFLTVISLLAAMVSCRKVELPQESISDGMGFRVSLAGYSQESSLSNTKALTAQGCGEVIYLTEESGEWEVEGEGSLTKSAPVTSMYSSFGCSAYPYAVFGDWTGDELPTVFYNRELTKSASGWEFADGNDYKWPGATWNVKFFAYSPYSTTNPKMVSSESAPGAPEIEFTCGTDVAAQVDLLECESAPYIGSSSTQVDLTFRHALAGIRIKTSDFGFAGKITRVEIQKVNSYGKTVIGSDVWTDQSTPVDYIIEPSLNITESGDCEPASSFTVFCIPQVLGAEALMKITFEQNSQEYVYECPLLGKELRKNTLTVYTLGCNPEDLASGINLSAKELEFTNTSGSASQTVNVKSYTVHASGISRGASWTVQYSTNGTTFSSTKPDWITLSATSGSGGIAGDDVSITVAARATQGKSMLGLQETERTAALKAKSEVGSSAAPVDLSMLDYNGNAVASMSTANCYVVHAPGWYKIPLVFGNAIKAGATNVEAFYTEGIATDFEDSYGVSFTASSSPYVKAHVLAAGKTLGAAELRWCDIETCVVDVDLELMDAGTDCPYIRVHIPQETISECNALVTVKDSDGNVVWSWHLWVSGRDLSPETITDNSSVNHKIMPVNLGWNGWIGTVSVPVYPARECYVKFSNTSGSRVVKVFQKEASTGGAGTPSGSTVYSSAPYYQWGRKDPFIGGSEAPSSMGNITYSSAGGSQAQAHQNPTVHYYNSSSYSWTTDKYYFFWDSKMNTTSKDQTVTKTIYDPCPVGYAIPRYKTFIGFTASGGYSSTVSDFQVVGSFNKGWYFKRNASDATGIFFPASGYRSYNTAGLNLVGSYGYYWLAAPGSTTLGHYLDFNSGCVYPQNNRNRAYGYSVRPAFPE